MSSRAAPRSCATLRAAMRAWMDEHGVDEPARHALLLAVGEACANAVEHAYHAATRARSTSTSRGRRIARSRVSVRDFGRFRDGRRRARTAAAAPTSCAASRPTSPRLDAAGTTVRFRLPMNVRSQHDRRARIGASETTRTASSLSASAARSTSRTSRSCTGGSDRTVRAARSSSSTSRRSPTSTARACGC